jgi:HSP20 family molecular chaperone IbpA
MSEQVGFSTIADAMADVVFGIANSNEGLPGAKLAKDIAAAVKQNEKIFGKELLENIPANIFYDKNGAKHIEVAIPGKTKENVKLSVVAAKEGNVLNIEVTSGELTDEQKELAEARKNGEMQRIKGMTSLKLSVNLGHQLDASAEAIKKGLSCENGLLTIIVPKVPEVQPVEITFD